MHMQEPQDTPAATAVAPAPATTSKAARSAMMIVFLVVFIDLLGFGIVLPLLPRYAADYLPVKSGFMYGLVIGALMSSFSAMQYLVAPIFGRVSDRVGRRPILMIGLTGSVIFYGLFGLVSEMAPSEGWLAIWLLLATRIGAGVSGATISTASAVIADCTTKEKRSHGMALIGAAFGIGFTFGPLIAWAGVSLFPEQRGGPGYLAAILSLGALIICVRKMPETLPPGGTHTKRSWIDLKGLFDTLKVPTVGLLVFTFFLTTFGFANFEGTISMLAQDTFKLDEKTNYRLFAYIGLVLVLTQGFIYRRLVKKLDEVKLMRIGIVAMFLGLGGMAALVGLMEPTHPRDSLRRIPDRRRGLRVRVRVSEPVAQRPDLQAKRPAPAGGNSWHQSVVFRSGSYSRTDGGYGIIQRRSEYPYVLLYVCGRRHAGDRAGAADEDKGRLNRLGEPSRVSGRVGQTVDP